MNNVSGSNIYKFKLFVAGKQVNSNLALENLQAICKEYIGENYEIEVIDIMEDYKKALKYMVLVAPMVIKEEPPPRENIAGNLSDKSVIVNMFRQTV